MLLVLASALVVASSSLITACLRLVRTIDAILALWLLSLGQIVGATWCLSVFSSIAAAGYLVAHATTFLSSLILWRCMGRPPLPKLQVGALSGEILDAIRRSRWGRPLAATVAALLLVHLMLSLAVPSGSHDSYTYHLSRSAYWLQHGTLDQFPTHNLRQVIFPPNASIHFLWTMALLRGDQLVALLSISSYGMLMIVIYGFSRRLGASRTSAAFAAVVWGAFPQNLFQSSVPADHMVSGALPAISLYFGLAGLSEGRRSILMLSGLALGLSVGTKFLAVFSGFSVALAMGIAAWQIGRPAMGRILAWGSWCVLFSLLLGLWGYVQNVRGYGDLFGGPTYAAFRVKHPGVPTAFANMTRCGYQFLDFTGPFFVDRPLHQLGARVAMAVGRLYDPNPPGSYSFEPFVALDLVRRRSADTAWYGPLAWGVLIPCWLVAVRRGVPQARLLLAAAVVYSLLLLTLLTWNPWLGRFFIYPVALGAPFMSLVVDLRRMRLLVMGSGVIALLSFANGLIYNPDRSLLGPRSIWEGWRAGSRFYAMKGTGDVVAQVDRILEDRPVRMAIIVGSDEMDYPFFGPKYCRNLVPLRLEDGLTPEFALSHRLDAALVSPIRCINADYPGWSKTDLPEGWTLYRFPPP